MDEEELDQTPEWIAETDRKIAEFGALLRAVAAKFREHEEAEDAKRTQLVVAEVFHNCQNELRKKQAEK